MAGVTTPIHSTFNATQFRTAIQQAMQMGQPNETSEQTTFCWNETDSYTPAGPDLDPYDWGETPTATVAAVTYVEENVAVEYATGTISGEAMGEFDSSRATLTILDTDWANVLAAGPGRNPDYVQIGGNAYDIDPPGPVATGLFSVDVIQLHCSART